jgi:homocysteine S-methyltransferase
MDEFEPLVLAIRWIRAEVPDAVVAVSFAASQDGFTGAGLHYRDLIDAVREEGADLAGLNCVSGPAHMLGLLRRLDLTRGDLIAMPNAGYPARVNGRLLYEDNPGYFAEKLKDMKRLGVKVLGGCCGTTPEHIRRAVACCAGEIALPAQAKAPERQTTARCPSSLAEKIARGNLAIVEVDPPVDADISHLMGAARRLRDAGADALTLADAPLARARADSLMMAAMTLRETGVDVVPHLTCRDRNRIAVRGALLAAHAGGVRNALIVTGDPIPGASHGPDESAADKGVFNFNSFSLIDFLRGMNAGPFANAPFFILAALNISAANFDAELRRAERKIARGADAFVTQSIFSKEGVVNLKKASEALGKPVIAGIMPVAGYKNAVFLNNEVPGVSIPKAFVDSLENQSRDVVTERSLAFSRALIAETKPFCAGFCVMTPMKRVDLAEALLQSIKGGQ